MFNVSGRASDGVAGSGHRRAADNSVVIGETSRHVTGLDGRRVWNSRREMAAVRRSRVEMSDISDGLAAAWKVDLTSSRLSCPLSAPLMSVLCHRNPMNKSTHHTAYHNMECLSTVTTAAVSHTDSNSHRSATPAQQQPITLDDLPTDIAPHCTFMFSQPAYLPTFRPWTSLSLFLFSSLSSFPARSMRSMQQASRGPQHVGVISGWLLLPPPLAELKLLEMAPPLASSPRQFMHSNLA